MAGLPCCGSPYQMKTQALTIVLVTMSTGPLAISSMARRQELLPTQCSKCFCDKLELTGLGRKTMTFSRIKRCTLHVLLRFTIDICRYGRSLRCQIPASLNPDKCTFFNFALFPSDWASGEPPLAVAHKAIGYTMLLRSNDELGNQYLSNSLTLNLPNYHWLRLERLII